MIVILFGVAGVGKTTIGLFLAKQLGWKFYDADDYHPVANIEKMRSGVPLTDADRDAWLKSLRDLIARHIAEGENGVLACSALKASYRRYLQVNDAVRYVYLKAELTWIARRLKNRRGHFMNPNLLQSQFDALEEPRGKAATVIDAAQSPRAIIRRIRDELGI